MKRLFPKAARPAAYLASLLALALSLDAGAQQAPVPSKPATEATKAANAQVLKDLPFNDKSDFDDAQRGFIARPETLTIKGDKGQPVWDLEQYKKFISLDQPAPDTINPSLYRIAQLNMSYGLFKVTDRIYQVRGYDLSNITFIQGKTGWIVFDPLISSERPRRRWTSSTRRSASARWWPCSTATATSTTTAACTASWTRPT
jgi:alkyl sulfatase BDS1-like metallo-beta-lactamase superfamily hydrolase